MLLMQKIGIGVLCWAVALLVFAVATGQSPHRWFR